ncbi:hypothetical protein MNB_SUP05-11-585 [hydrothermal vent metagenome]|uniref:DUF2846 domain-containing protein n=1 Tax=hydrothermal vent metagenome TaxID=652676 RepID=A0A1W1DD52_9ZZZZ
MMSDSEDISKKQFLAPKNGKSGLYIYRTYNFVGAARTPTLYLDGNEIGDIAAKSYIFTEIKPGIHTISAGGFFENTDKLKSTFKTESGKNHFVEASFSLGIFIGQVVLEEVAENIGKKGVLETNLAK